MRGRTGISYSETIGGSEDTFLHFYLLVSHEEEEEVQKQVVEEEQGRDAFSTTSFWEQKLSIKTKFVVLFSSYFCGTFYLIGQREH